MCIAFLAACIPATVATCCLAVCDSTLTDPLLVDTVLILCHVWLEGLNASLVKSKACDGLLLCSESPFGWLSHVWKDLTSSDETARAEAVHNQNFQPCIDTVPPLQQQQLPQQQDEGIVRSEAR